MLIGYARTSTTDQIAGLEAQERDLTAHGCERLWLEQTSSVGPRTALEEAISFARSGDSLAVTKICRLARSVADLVAIIDRLEKKGVSLRILSMGVDTATPTGRLMLNLLASISQFEREVMLERQREGVAKAKAEGKYKGRKPTARAKSDQILELDREGLSREGIATKLGIGVASVYRVLKAARTDFNGSRANGRLVPASRPSGWR
jgi:DNA invertase Pin-like site-specific DNA recombinase